MTSTSRRLTAALLGAVLTLAPAAAIASGSHGGGGKDAPAAQQAAARRVAARRAAPGRRAGRAPGRRSAGRGRGRGGSGGIGRAGRGRGGARQPAASKPRDKQLGLTATPDPFAPPGRTPKILFDVHNAVRGRSYRIMARQAHGQPQYAPGNDDTPQCTIAIGSTEPRRSPVDGDFPWGRTPADFDDPSEGYDAINGTPCQGAWEGEMEEIGGRGARSIEFVMAIPEMTIDVVYRFG